MFLFDAGETVLKTSFSDQFIGGDVDPLSRIMVSLQFVSKKGWALDYDLLRNVHSVRLGVKLF